MAELPKSFSIAETNSEMILENCLNDINYYKISGTLDERRLEKDSEVLVSVNKKIYRAYHTGENGFCLYLKKSDFTEDSASIKVYAANADICVQMLAETVKLPTE